MIEKLNLISVWKNASNKEKKAFLIGVLLGIILMSPILAIDDNVLRPISYNSTIVEDKVTYNFLYNKYCEEVGNATDFDRVIIISPLVDNNTYRNIAITVINFADSIFLRYICFVDVDDNVIEKIITPEADEAYSIENISNLKSVVIFLYSTMQIYSIELWVW